MRIDIGAPCGDAGRMMKRLLVPLALLAAPAVMAQSAAPFTVDGGRGYYRLDDAVRALGGGDGIITVAPGVHRDCATVRGGNITIRAAAPSTAILDGVACDGKAALVLDTESATIDGLVFRNIHVPDGNGAGIRLERGDLTVTRSTFLDSEEGILTAPDPAHAIVIDHSTFSGLGGCPDGGCSHGLYVGDYGSLKVTASRFERGTGGHYLKSRAARAEILDSSFDDSRGAGTNYMIDLPAGAVGRIAGNIFVQGKDKENHSAFIAVAAEARDHPSAGLVIEDNQASFAPGVTWPSVFVADWSHEPLRLGANRLAPRLKPFETR